MSTDSTRTSLDKDSKKQKLAAAAAEAASEERDEEEDEEEDEEDDRDSDRRDSQPTFPTQKVAIDRPSSFKMILTIAGRELGSYFNSAISYIVIGVSMLVLGLYFFYYKGGFWQIDRATMTRMFEALPLALCFLTIPLFTMRSLSDEKRVGTIELLITMPLKDSEVILGKFLASFAMVCLQLALVALYPIAMFKWPWHMGELDWNPFWVGMLGLMLLSAAGTAIGLMWSSFTESQILSYFATMLTLIAALRDWLGHFDRVRSGLGGRRPVVHQPPESIRFVRTRHPRYARNPLFLFH